MGVVVGVDSKGHATLQASGCSLDIGHLDITFHGGARLLLFCLSYISLPSLVLFVARFLG